MPGEIQSYFTGFEVNVHLDGVRQRFCVAVLVVVIDPSCIYCNHIELFNLFRLQIFINIFVIGNLMLSISNNY